MAEEIFLFHDQNNSIECWSIVSASRSNVIQLVLLIIIFKLCQ